MVTKGKNKLFRIIYFFRNVFQFLIIFFLFVSLIFYETTSYLSEQFHGQFNLLLSSKPIKAPFDSTEYNLQEVEKLEWIETILNFAQKELNYETGKSYLSMVNPVHWPLILMVNVSEPFAIKSYQYQFPPFFNFPYLGYFNFSRANKEMHRKMAQGYDVGYGFASGWSMLGIIPDPVFRPWLKESKPRLAELIFHELTHSNIFFSDSSDYNENIACFIGRQATLNLLAQQTDSGSLLKKYHQEILYEDSLQRFVSRQSLKLERFYKEIETLPHNLKLTKKEEFFGRIIQELFLQKWLEHHQKLKLAGKIRLQKNAFFSSFQSYRADHPELKKLFENSCRRDLKVFVENLKRKSGK